MHDKIHRQFRVQLVFVDETKVFEAHGLDAVKASEFVAAVEALGRGFGFEFTSLPMPREMVRDLAAGMDDIALQNVREHTSSVTAWEDRRLSLKLDLLLEFAAEHGCTRVVLGDSATSVAARVVADSTKGLPLNSPHLALQERLSGAGSLKSILRPLNDVLDEELFLVVRHAQLQPANLPLGIMVDSSAWQRQSLNTHCRRLVAMLQVPATHQRQSLSHARNKHLPLSHARNKHLSSPCRGSIFLLPARPRVHSSNAAARSLTPTGCQRVVVGWWWWCCCCCW